MLEASTITYSPELQSRIVAYYEHYYRSCGLTDWRERAQSRLSEEVVEAKRMEKLQTITGYAFTGGQRHCIVGAGTGGLAVVLKAYGCKVYGVEPDQEQLTIIKQKCAAHHINPDNFKREWGEQLSFADNQFDVVHCFTVIEHVRSIELCLNEMIRVCKPGGLIYINTPNYNYPEERHYKIFAPTFLPKICTYLWLIAHNKPLTFLRDINFVTPRMIDQILSRRPVTWYRIYRGNLEQQTPPRGAGVLLDRFLRYLRTRLTIYPQQDIVIRKIP